MKNIFGSNLSLTVFGESHGPAVGCVLDGLAPGIDVKDEIIEYYLSKRRPDGKLSTARKEPDKYRILSGVFNGKTTGTPLTIAIENTDTKSSDYVYGPARPSHADYAAFCKYNGYEDYRGGGHFSGRVTAALVAASGILIPALEKLGIDIGTHILKCKDVNDRAFDDVDLDVTLLKAADFPVLDKEAGDKISNIILEAKNNLDSVGGITQTGIVGLKPGIGEPWFDSVESILSHGLFSIGAIKGVEFGLGFGFADQYASACNDAFRMEEDRVVTKSNNNGGINGGITNGMPVVFNCAVKPTPSISKEQETVDFIKKEDSSLVIKGRHDPAIIRRICPVIDAVTALCVADMLVTKYGTDYLAGV